MSEKPTRSVADRLKDLNALLVGATQILNSLPTELHAPPVEAAELAAIRQAQSPEEQERAIAAVRASARQRLKHRLEEAVRFEIALGDAALRVHELVQLIRHTRGRAAEFTRDGGNASQDEIERSITAAEHKKPFKKPAEAA